MYKFLIAALFLIPIVAEAQRPITFVTADSITYQCYVNGDWDQLIETGNQAIGQNIDYKRLRQRMGYAYFVKTDYYSAQIQYEKALIFDAYDADTRAYLYYCGLNTGNEAFARFHAEKLPKDLQQRLKEEAFKPANAIDLEFNYKANNVLSRSNPTYLRAGLSTQLSYRVTLYQSVSNYQQTIDSSLTKQPEYYALLNWSLTSHLSLDVAYHYLNVSVDGYKYPGNMVLAALTTKINRFSLGINGSILRDAFSNYKQIGLHGGVTLPGKSSIYFKSSISEIVGKGDQRTIFSQVAGARLSKALWAEGNVTLGNLKNYNDHNGLYIYNSVDPTTFRTGATMYWYIGKHMTLLGNYTYETKQIELTNFNYSQYSFTGGIIWKL
ncbi:MAG: hypothetical protein GZ094_15200 [Mariniphaga sp.]|nr:hypothetical protein [Mariniphaga sp.]